jgi:hypothetical protein
MEVTKLNLPNAKEDALLLGSKIQAYEGHVKKAFEYARELKEMGIGQPWIDVEYDAKETEAGFGKKVRHKGFKDGVLFHTYACRIRLEAR